MANPEHVKILKWGTDAWNSWRTRNPGEQPILTGADLSEADLTGIAFHDAYLREANLGGANLRRANLSGACLIEADLHGANLGTADLSGASMDSADLHQASLRGASVGGADLSGANLREADLAHADLCGANLSGANLNKAVLRSANLSRAALYRADLGAASLQHAVLEDADLTLANLAGADLTEATLSGARLTGANTSNWQVGRVTCTHVMLQGARVEYGAAGSFERAWNPAGSVAEMVVHAPLSDLTHYAGRITAWLVNHQHGRPVLALRGQTELSPETVRQEFTVLPQDDRLTAEVQNLLNRVQTALSPVFAGLRRDAAAPVPPGGDPPCELPEEVSLSVPGVEAQLLPLVEGLARRFERLPPALVRVVQAVQSALAAAPPLFEPAGAGRRPDAAGRENPA